MVCTNAITFYNRCMQTFDNAWCYESVRLRESQKPRLDDHHANQLAILAGPDVRAQLLARATELARLAGVDTAQQTAKQFMRVGLILLWCVSFVVGASAGIASLGDATRPVNLLWALGSLLLVPSIAMVVWLATLLTRTSGGGWIGRLWQTVVARLLKPGATTSTWQAWLQLTKDAGANRWWFAFLTHSMWFWVLSGMLLAVMVSFSLRHFTFEWQTTWLSSDVFVQLAQIVGALPNAIGFSTPDTEMIAASGNAAIDEPFVRLAWANWLVGAIFVFGWLPRLILASVSWAYLRSRRLTYTIQIDDAYALAIRSKLDRLIAYSTVDGPAGAQDHWQTMVGIATDQACTESAVLALEAGLPAALHARLPAESIVLPPVDDGQSRRDALARLERLKPARLLVLVDARQTPDRGLIGTILSMGSQAVNTQVLLMHSSDSRARLGIWRERLNGIGLSGVNEQIDQALAWLRPST